VTMPILIGAFTKNSEVFFLAPAFYPEFVGGIEAFYPCEIYH
jgi:hypothetical protein